jgi:hypothetical protein
VIGQQFFTPKTASSRLCNVVRLKAVHQARTPASPWFQATAHNLRDFRIAG